MEHTGVHGVIFGQRTGRYGLKIHLVSHWIQEWIDLAFIGHEFIEA